MQDFINTYFNHNYTLFGQATLTTIKRIIMMFGRTFTIHYFTASCRNEFMKISLNAIEITVTPPHFLKRKKKFFSQLSQFFFQITCIEIHESNHLLIYNINTV